MNRHFPSDIFIPASPTISPMMLIKPSKSIGYLPFCSQKAHYFYFARNAIWQMVKFLGLDRGEVLVPAYHHGVEIEALMDAGAKVKFYRIGSKWEVDLNDVTAKIGPQTTALYLTHFAGFPGPVREMKRLAEEHNIPLIEDCALSLLSKDGDIPLGVTGDVAIFCLYKMLALPNGGAMIINNSTQYNFPEPAKPPISSIFSVVSASILRNLALRGGRIGQQLRSIALKIGKSVLRRSEIEPVMVGTEHFNRKHLNLGIGWITKQIAFAQDIESIINSRRYNYLYALENLRDISPPLFENLPQGVVPLCYPLVVDNNRTIMQRLLARGVEAVDFWRAFHPACNPAEFPEVAKLRLTILEVPNHQDITAEMMARIVAIIREELMKR
ncbi:MAG: DegT/DnrJ/EryC1/StrS family aminotransferase [Acidobacteriota bacterium]